MPGGVNSPVRAMGSIGRDPIFIDRGEGCELIDVDGNRYVDWVCSWGPLILGHADPAVVAAVTEAAARGTSYGAATAGEVELAAEVADRFASVEMVRMVNSGTEATMSAIRLARAATGRERADQVRRRLPRPRRRPARRGGLGARDPGHPGQPRRSARPGRGDRGRPLERPRARSSRRSTCTSRRRSSASRSPANMGAGPARATASSSTCARSPTARGALLIFDEVITGFRVARGGAQELLGVDADLTVMGKVIGGGLPAAAYGGRRELMERVAPAGDVYQAGTLSGNPLAVAAGLATLRRLDAGAYERLGGLTDRLAAGLAAPPAASGERPGQRRLGPRPGDAVLQRRAAARLRRRPAPATSTPTAASAARCSSAASTRRPRSSRPGSSRSPTTTTAIDRDLRGRRRVLPRGARLTMTESPLRPEDALADLAAQLRAEGPVVAVTSPSPTPTRRSGCSSPPARAARATPGGYALRGRVDPRGLPLHYREPRLLAAARPRSARCSPATTSTPAASSGWPALGDLVAVRELSDLISSRPSSTPRRAPIRAPPSALARRARSRSRRGPGAEHERAKAALREGGDGAAPLWRRPPSAAPSEAGLAEPLAGRPRR